MQSRAKKTSQAAMPRTGLAVISMPDHACRQMPKCQSQRPMLTLTELPTWRACDLDHAIKQTPTADSTDHRLLRSPSSPLTATRMVDAALYPCCPDPMP